MKKIEKWQKIILVIIVLFLLDGVKAYFLAVHYAKRDKFISMSFAGVWIVNFRASDPPSGICTGESLIIAPILPIVLGRHLEK